MGHPLSGNMLLVRSEQPRVPFAPLTNLTLLSPRLTRLEIGAAVIAAFVFIVATHWSYPGAVVVVLPTLVLVRVPTVGVLHVGQTQGSFVNAGAGESSLLLSACPRLHPLRCRVLVNLCVVDLPSLPSRDSRERGTERREPPCLHDA